MTDITGTSMNNLAENPLRLPCKPLHDALIPLNPMLKPELALHYTPGGVLSMAGKIVGLYYWYEEDKLQDQEPDWAGNAIKVDLMEIVYLFLTRVYQTPRSHDSRDQFWEVIYNEDVEPIINFDIEKVAVVINASQCQALLDAIGANREHYDPALAQQPAFPPM